jgi:hypothetical protein
MNMASITISTASPIKTSVDSELTGEEKLITVNGKGKPSAITVNQILDKMDDNIVANVESQVITSGETEIKTRVDEVMEEVKEEVIDQANNLTWNDVS